MTSSLSNIETKILAIFVILLAGCIGASLPSITRYFTSRSKSISPSKQKFIAKLLTSMSAGIVVTTALLHVGADAVTLVQESGGVFADATFPYLPSGEKLGDNETISPLHEEHNHPYPYVAMIVVFTIMITFFISTEISAWGTNKMKQLKAKEKLRINSKSSTRNTDNVSSSRGAGNHPDQEMSHYTTILLQQIDNTEHEAQRPANEQQETQQQQQDAALLSAEEKNRFSLRIQLNQIIAGVAVHSFILGITLGISRDQATSRVLMCVLMLDCMFDGLAVGNLILAAELPLLISMAYVATFALMAPIGVAFGVAIETPDLRAQGIMSAVSSGLLLRMAFEFFHQIFEESAGGHHHNHQVDDRSSSIKINDITNNDESKKFRLHQPSSSVTSTLELLGVNFDSTTATNTSQSNFVVNDNKEKSTDVNGRTKDENDENNDDDFMETFAFRAMCYFVVCAGAALQMGIRVWE